MSRMSVSATAGLVLLALAGPARAQNFWEKNCEAIQDFNVFIEGLYQGYCVCDSNVVNPNLEVGQLTVAAGEGLRPEGEDWVESVCYKKQGKFANDRIPKLSKTRSLTTTVPGLLCYKASEPVELPGVCGSTFHIKVDLTVKLGAKGLVWGEFAGSVKWGFEGKGYRGKYWSKQDGMQGQMPIYKITSEAGPRLPSWTKATLTLDAANKVGTDTTNWYAAAVGTTNMGITTGKFLNIKGEATTNSPYLSRINVEFEKSTFCGQTVDGRGHVALAHATRYNCTNDPATPEENQEQLKDMVKAEELPEPGKD